MKFRQYFTKPLKHSWLIFCLAMILVLGAMLLFQSTRQGVGHDVSAADYATLIFDGLVSTNGAQYASFRITNHYKHPLRFSVNNIEIRTEQGWRYYASWSPGLQTHPLLGRLDNPAVSPGTEQTFLVPSP